MKAHSSWQTRKQGNREQGMCGPAVIGAPTLQNRGCEKVAVPDAFSASAVTAAHGVYQMKESLRKDDFVLSVGELFKFHLGEIDACKIPDSYGMCLCVPRELAEVTAFFFLHEGCQRTEGEPPSQQSSGRVRRTACATLGWSASPPSLALCWDSLL